MNKRVYKFKSCFGTGMKCMIYDYIHVRGETQDASV